MEKSKSRTWRGAPIRDRRMLGFSYVLLGRPGEAKLGGGRIREGLRGPKNKGPGRAGDRWRVSAS